MAQTRLSLVAAQSKLNVAANEAIQHKFREYRLLLSIGESGKSTTQLDPATAITLARLVRDTLASEYDLALSKLDASKKELIVSQDAVDEALVFLTDAEQQLGQIFNTLRNAHIVTPTYKHLTPSASLSPNAFERPDNLFCYPAEEEESSSSRSSSSWSSSSQDVFHSCHSGGRSPSLLAASTPFPH